MSILKRILFLILFGFSLVSGFACEGDGPLEEAGEGMEETMEETEEEFEDED
ncbi:MAG: hypothetical protein ACOC0U_03900 [Desulfovibrionales bacterium]